jgi:hypothetical protein
VVGALICVPLFVALNFVRLVNLFYLGVYEPNRFDLAHDVLWEAAMVVGIYAMWLSWKVWADRRSARATPSSVVGQSGEPGHRPRVQEGRMQGFLDRNRLLAPEKPKVA